MFTSLDILLGITTVLIRQSSGECENIFDSYIRMGDIPTTCPDNYPDYELGLCYRAPSSGYDCTSAVCTKWCSFLGIPYICDVYDRGFTTGECASNEYLSAGLCYGDCMDGYASETPLCICDLDETVNTFFNRVESIINGVQNVITTCSAAIENEAQDVLNNIDQFDSIDSVQSYLRTQLNSASEDFGECISSSGIDNLSDMVMALEFSIYEAALGSTEFVIGVVLPWNKQQEAEWYYAACAGITTNIAFGVTGGIIFYEDKSSISGESYFASVSGGVNFVGVEATAVYDDSFSLIGAGIALDLGLSVLPVDFSGGFCSASFF